MSPALRQAKDDGAGSVMTFDEAVDYLKGRERYGIKFGLENIDRLAEALGRPERRFASILVAGTNGKGSTAALLESVLRASGLATGRYTSPHIRSITERIHVAGAAISEKELALAVSRVATKARKLWEDEPEGSAPTFFEAVTAAAFVAFAERKVELAVLEVGMGGRYDATNIAPAGLSVITPIGFDHERFLGTTLHAIAAEKAAIIKTGRPVVVGRLEPEALDVVREEARARSAPLVHAHEGVEVEAGPEGADGARNVRLRTPARDYGKIVLPLAGEHQLDNLVVAVRVAELTVPSLRPEEVGRGVAATRWPGRLERIPGAPPLLLDAAHNLMAAESLARYLAAHPARARRVLVFGVMKDKRVYEMLELLLPHVSGVVVTRPAMSRAREPEKLARWVRERGVPAEARRPSMAALERGRELAGPDGDVVVAGSIFLLGEVAGLVDRLRAESASLAEPV